MTMGRESIFTAGYLGFGPALIRTLHETYGFTETQAKVGGAVPAGILAAALSHPMDTIKTCMQGDMDRKVYGGVMDTARRLHQEGGVARFFNGGGWRTLRVTCGFFIINECKLRFSPLLFPKYFED